VWLDLTRVPEFVARDVDAKAFTVVFPGADPPVFPLPSYEIVIG
jgi:hypothetical protein